MLYLESRQGGKKDSAWLVFFAVASFLLLLASCNDSSTYTQKRNLTLETFNSLKVEEYALDSVLIGKNLEHFSCDDNAGNYAAKHVRQYYADNRPMVWVDYSGVDVQADSLADVLERQLADIGFNATAFCLPQIREDIERLRQLKFDKKNSINTIVARLEYNLSKAFVAYAAGQRFGFVNPQYVLNRYDVRDKDSTGNVINYRNLFDVDIERPGTNYVSDALQQVASGSVSAFLRSSEPVSPFYHRLLGLLHHTDGHQRQKILVNMERCRWREKQNRQNDEKYVVVNVSNCT